MALLNWFVHIWHFHVNRQKQKTKQVHMLHIIRTDQVISISNFSKCLKFWRLQTDPDYPCKKSSNQGNRNHCKKIDSKLLHCRHHQEVWIGASAISLLANKKRWLANLWDDTWVQFAPLSIQDQMQWGGWGIFISKLALKATVVKKRQQCTHAFVDIRPNI